MKSPWEGLIGLLVSWTRNLIVRRDAYGKYIAPSDRRDPKKAAFTEKSEPTDAVLKAHFAGDAVVGLFTIGDDGHCRMAVVDIDRHDDEGSAEVNELAAITFYDRALKMGLSSFLEDSNGRGGFKLRLVFSEPVPARTVRRLLRWLIEDWEELGLITEPEIFPKQDALEPGKFGNFDRLPGRHHTLAHWSRIWGDGRWLKGEDAARKILSVIGSTAASIPDEFRRDTAAPASPKPRKTMEATPLSPKFIGMLRSAIKSLPSNFPDSYDTWLKCGMSLYDLGDAGLELWKQISRRCPRYREGACEEKWRSFRPNGGLTWKTILHLAAKNGWKRGRRTGRREVKQNIKGELASGVNGGPIPTQHEARVEDATPPEGALALESAAVEAPATLHEAIGSKQELAPPQVASVDDDPSVFDSAAKGGNDEPIPPVGRGGDSSSTAPRSRPEIVWNNRPPDEVTEEALKIYKASSGPKKVFSRGGGLIRLVSTENGPVSAPLSEEALEGILARIAIWKVHRGKDKHGNDKFDITPPQSFVVRDITALGEYDPTIFPPLKGIVRSPYFASDGSLVDSPGYHATSALWYEPDPDLIVPDVPLNPSDEDIKKAKNLLVDELLGDFRFKTPSDLANALAFLFTPLVRNLFEGPSPFGLIEAPEKGTGKSLLARCVASVAAGRVSSSPQPESDAEWRKAITTYLTGSPPVIFFDNLAKKLESPSLEKALTDEVWIDRGLGTNQSIVLSAHTTWLGTANNLAIFGDLDRRFVWIRLDARMARPFERDPSEFRHPDLLEWALENRGDLLWAALTIIRTWIVRGKPLGHQSMASFHSWAKTIGGILDVMKIPGFLEVQKERLIEADDFSAQLEGLYNAIHQKLGSDAFGVRDLGWLVDPDHPEFDDETTAGLLNAEKKGERGKLMGWLLRKTRDRIFGNKQLVLVGRDGRSNCCKYQIKEIEAEGPELLQPPSPHETPHEAAQGATRVLVNSERSRRFWNQYHDRGLDDCDGVRNAEQLFELCHALWVGCEFYRALRIQTLVRLAESHKLLPRVLPSEWEGGRVFDMEKLLEDINWGLGDLMQFQLYDDFYYEGRRVRRYVVLEPSKALELKKKADMEKESAPTPRNPHRADVSDFLKAEYYGTLVDLCRYWWIFADHEISGFELYRLVVEFNLLPGFADAYPLQPQFDDLAELLEEIHGVEFDGFVIGIRVYTWPTSEDGQETLTTLRYYLELLPGCAPPRSPVRPTASDTRKRFQKPYVFGPQDFTRMFGRP